MAQYVITDGSRWIMKDKNEKFSRCPKCFSETKYTNIQVSELTFGEYLHRELNKKGHIK